MACIWLLLRLVCIIIMKPSANQDPKGRMFEILPEMVVGPRLFIHGLQNVHIFISRPTLSRSSNSSRDTGRSLTCSFPKITKNTRSCSIKRSPRRCWLSRNFTRLYNLAIRYM